MKTARLIGENIIKSFRIAWERYDQYSCTVETGALEPLRNHVYQSLSISKRVAEEKEKGHPALLLSLNHSYSSPTPSFSGLLHTNRGHDIPREVSLESEKLRQKLSAAPPHPHPRAPLAVPSVRCLLCLGWKWGRCVRSGRHSDPVAAEPNGFATVKIPVRGNRRESRKGEKGSSLVSPPIPLLTAVLRLPSAWRIRSKLKKELVDRAALLLTAQYGEGRWKWK